jgi:hypothetical protein
MSPREVSSLNAIAKAHGGQLTTNPHTGLPEAGFLESILPMAAGAALVASGVGAPYAALMVGGGMTLATGSLEKGLMAGLGAYSGGSLGESLLAGGASPVAANVAESGVASAASAESQIAMQKTLEEQARAQALATQNSAIQQAAVVSPPPPGAMNSADLLAKQNALSGSAPIDASVTPAPQTSMNSADLFAKQRQPAFGTTLNTNLSSGITNVPPAPSFMDNIKAMGSNISPSSLMNFVKDKPLDAAAGAASLYSPKEKQEEEKRNTDMGQRYAYGPGYANPTPGASASGQEQTFMNPSYRPIDNAEAKKIYGFADGGATADPAAPPVPASYTAAEPTAPISKPIPAFNIPEVDSLSDLIRAKESRRFIDAYLNRPAPTDVQAQYNDYLQRTLNASPMSAANSGVRAVTPSTSANADNEFVFDANTQRYVPNPKFAEGKAAAEKAKKKPSIGSIGGLGPGRAAGGSISESKSAPVDVQAQYNDYLQRTLNTSPASAPNSGVRAAVANPSRAETAAEKKLNIGSDGGFSPGRSTGLSTNNNEKLGNALLSTVNKIGSDIHQIRFAEGGDTSGSQSAPIDVMAQYNDYLQSNYTPMPVANSGIRATPSASADSSSQYVYNPRTQSFDANPNYVDPEAQATAEEASAAQPVQQHYIAAGKWAPQSTEPSYIAAGKWSEPPKALQPYPNAKAGYYAAGGGISDAAYNLGGYSDGGRLLRGPGDGVSDSIPAVIGKKQPARLADGEFVVPARIVSELGNGSTEAGARKLYAMMDRIQKARGKTVGKGKVAKNSRSEKYLPA